MNTYELLYIIPTTFTDEEMGGIETKISALITKYGATVTSTERLGKMRLAYAINNQRHGHYVMALFQAEPASMAKIAENLRISTDILRSLITKVEGEAGKYELVQFVEVDVNSKDDKKRKEMKDKKDEKAEEGKEAPAAEKSEPTDAEKAEVIDKKVEEVLKEEKKA